MEPEKAQTLDRAVKILDCFSQEHPELGVREVARMVDLSTSAVGRLMSAMKELGILSQNPNTRVYSLGARVLSWAGVYTANLDVRTVALPPLQELYHDTNETVSLYVLDGNERVCVERWESSLNVRIVARVGRRLPLYAGSAGKVFLAFLPEERREQILSEVELEPLTRKTIVDPVALRRELVKIRNQGYGVSEGEWILDASGVAAPVFDQDGAVVAVVTISGPSQRFTRAVVAGYIPRIMEVAAGISKDMGYRDQRINRTA